MGMKNLRMADLHGWTLVDQQRLFYQKDTNLFKPFLLLTKRHVDYNIVDNIADRSVQERESDFCRQKSIQRNQPPVTWKNWTNNTSGILLLR
jgi:hypothetical protein